MNGRKVLTLVMLGVGLMGERFAYYGVRAVLMLMMIKKLELSSDDARKLYSSFTTGIYLLTIVAAIACLLIGPRLVVLAGGIVSTFGMIILAGASATPPLITGM